MPPELSVIVPTYNEEKTILNVLDSLARSLALDYEIVIVDDGSSDRTVKLVQDNLSKYPAVQLIQHEQNKGKTAALITGIEACTGQIVIVQDADLEYDPKEIPAVIAPIRMGRADVVYGSRFFTRRVTRILYLRHYLANRFLTFLSNLLTNLNFSDVETCYKAFRGEIIRNMILTSKRFGFEVEVTAKIAKLQCRIYEVPISYYGRTYQEGKKIGLIDGLHAIFYIFKYTLFTSRKAAYKNSFASSKAVSWENYGEC